MSRCRELSLKKIVGLNAKHCCPFEIKLNVQHKWIRVFVVMFSLWNLARCGSLTLIVLNVQLVHDTTNISGVSTWSWVLRRTKKTKKPKNIIPVKDVIDVSTFRTSCLIFHPPINSLYVFVLMFLRLREQSNEVYGPLSAQTGSVAAWVHF